MKSLNNIESQQVNELYKKYLEQVLNVTYKNVFIKKESKLYNSRECLCSNSGEELTDYLDSIIELDQGNYYLGRIVNSNNEPENIFFDAEGKEINRIKNVLIEKFCDGIARVVTVGRNPRCGYIDVKGNLISEMQWGIASGDFKCGRARVVGVEGKSKDKYGFIDKNGKLVIPCRSEHFAEFSDNVVSVSDVDAMKYYDLDGNFLFAELHSARDFSCGLVRYRELKKYGFMDKTGEVKIKAKYKYLGDFNNGIASADGGFIDLSGKKVKVKQEVDGVPYIKGVINNIYYNSYTGNYDKFNMIPFKDIEDYLLLIDNGFLVLYGKRDGSYTNTNIRYGDKLDIKRVGNFLIINGMNFYLKAGGCVSLPSSLDLSRVISYEDNEVLSFEDFETKINQDKYFYMEIMNYDKQDEEKRILAELENKKNEQDAKRQEIINQLQYLKDALQTLNDTSGNLSKIDEELLFMKVGDHYEIKPEFANQLSFLDLHYLNFKNVKVSGLNFAGSNASINPQEVYQKDMSNGVYDGLIFTSKDFSNVNLKGASFKECNMDFALLDEAIVDDTTKFSDSLKF